jgi:class I fructose-bisphosphate aldolase
MERKQARLNRLLTAGRCLDIAVDHGVCNEPGFLSGLEDMPAVMDQLIAAAPDAIQLNFGQADLLQQRPGRNKPALVMRVDMGNPYNATRHRVMWAMLQNHDDPVLPAVQMDAACAVINLFMLPDEPELFRQCVANIARVRADCDRYGMPLMIEPLVMAPHAERGGYMVDGDAEKIVTRAARARDGRRHREGRPHQRPGRVPSRGAGRPLPGARARRWPREPAAGLHALA